jgi:hypothetical protein
MPGVARSGTPTLAGLFNSLNPRPQFAPAGSSLPVNPLGQLRQIQHLHPIGQWVTAVPRDRSRQRQRCGPDGSLGPAVD